MIPGLILPLYISLLSILFGNDEAELVFAGDAMQHKAQIEAARSGNGKYDYSNCFTDIAEIVRAADYAVVNLETPVSAPPHTGYPCFNAPSEFIDALSQAGFDMFLTANNHTLDRGAKGLRSTITELDSRRLDHIGTYTDERSRSEALPKIVDVNGFKIGFLNYTYGTNGIEPNDGVSVDYINKELIKKDIEATRKAGAELIAACIHWGDEYRLLPNAAQRGLADYIEGLGVEMIIGGHPHVIQPMEFRQNRYFPDRKVLLTYSLGNFISNMKTHDTRGGVMVHVKLSRDANHKAQLEEASYRLVFTIPGSSPADNFRLTEPDSVDIPAWKGRADIFSKRARDIFDKHNIGVSETK